MSPSDIMLIVAVVVAFYAAWNIGANDVANAMGTSVGSKALTLLQAVIAAAIFEFLGAVLFGANVSETIERGIINVHAFADNPYVLVYGMLASLLATGIWLQLSSYLGLPVSTTHAIVGAIVGFGAVVGGIESVQWNHVWFIAGSWLVSPLLGAALSYAIFLLVRRGIFYQPRPYDAIRRWLPCMVGGVVLVLALITTHKIVIPREPLWEQIAVAIAITAIAVAATRLIVNRIATPEIISEPSIDPHLLIELQKAKKHLWRIHNATQGAVQFQVNDLLQETDVLSNAMQKQTPLLHTHAEYRWVERIFGGLQVATACMMAFAHGSNDVSNAVGPLAAIISLITPQGAAFPHWLLVLGGAGIVIGLATWGWRVIETIGSHITELTPSRGFSAEFGASCTILLASTFGFPISTTHTLVGAVLGVGLAGGIGSLNLKTLRDIALTWIITIPAGALLSIGCYFGLTALLPLQ